jgi:predicted MFS family arabinose efflux permease
MKKIAYCCCFGVVGLLTTEFGVIGMLPQLATHYHLSIDRAGWLLSGFALVVALAGPFTTLLASSLNRKVALLISLAPFVVSGVVSTLAPPFWLLLLVRVLPAFLHPVFYTTALGIVASGENPKEGPRLMAIVLSGIGLATVTTIPLVTYVASAWSWQASFGLCTGVCPRCP